MQKSKCKITVQSVNLMVCFLIFSAYAFQCSPSNKISNKKSTELNPYFPAAEGHYWEYINEAPREETELWKVEIRSQKSDGTDRIYTFSSFPFFFKEEKQTNIRIKEDGSVYMNDSNKIVPEIANLKSGYSWSFGIWDGNIASTSETVKAENEIFTNCIRINFAASITFTAELWLSKNNGVVKWGFFRTNPPTLTFTYYVLNKIQLH